MQALPAVFVCENNLYGEFTPMASVTAGGEIAARAGAYGIPSEVVDGNDVWAVREAAAGAVARARAGEGPTLLECETYRHFGHSKSDPAPYRPPEEVEQLEGSRPAHDRARPAGRGAWRRGSRGGRGAGEVGARTAVERAREAPFPDPAEREASEFKS